MNYKWRKQELIKLKKEIEKVGLEYDLENINTLLETYGQTLNLREIGITPKDSKFNPDEACYYFIHNLNKLPESIQDKLLDLFKIEKDFIRVVSPVDRVKFKPTNKELIELGHDCVNQFENKRLVQLYDKVTDKNSSFIHITKEIYTGASVSLRGLALDLKQNNSQYLYLARTGTTDDFGTLIHEFFHLYIYTLMNEEGLKYFSELEGRLGSFSAYKYLESIGLTKEADDLCQQILIEMIYSSFKLYMCDLLCSTIKDNKIDLKLANKTYKEEIGYKDRILKSEIPKYCSVYGFYEYTNLLCKLMILDLYEKSHDLNQVLYDTLQLKQNDNRKTLNRLKQYGITFQNDDYKNFRELYGRVRQ